MPEGDTLHKLAAALRPVVIGEGLRGLWLRDRGWIDFLEGGQVDDVAAVGKHLLVSLCVRPEPDARASRWVAHVHLGMRGRLHAYDPDAPALGSQPALRLELAKRGFVFRRVARAELLRAVDLAQHPSLSRLGPDLLEQRVDLDAIVARARHSQARAIADLLLDQRVACGIGNVYKSETLFLAGLDPFTPAAAVADEVLRELYASARLLLSQNLGGWRRTTVREVDAAHPLARGEPRYFVYGRHGQPCLRCATEVRVARQGDQARVTWWCPGCQPRFRR